LKKLVTTILLAVHLFNIAGPLLIYQYLEYQSGRVFEEQSSKNNYALEDLFEVKLPVNIPTVQDWKSYEYVSGRVEFNNNDYNYVKLKMTRDTIYLVCIPNYKTTKLNSNNVIDARNIADVPVNKKEHLPASKTHNHRLFRYYIPIYHFSTPQLTLNKTTDIDPAHLVNPAIARPGEPPEA
jgi:hypothetical protein